jgi:hypothetical protein
MGVSTLSPALSTYLSVCRFARLAVAACLLFLPLTLAPPPSLAAARDQPPRMRLSVSVEQNSYPREALVRVTSKPISVSLYDAPKPVLTLTTSPSPSATITPPAGKLRMVYQWLCPYDRGAEGTGPEVNWIPAEPDAAGTYRLEPGCAQPYQWHVAAGFPNEPVVYIEYCRPSRWGC